MLPELMTADLLRSVGLDLDGPARWGSKPSTRAPGIFAIEVERATRSPSFDIVEIRRWLQRVQGLRLGGERPTDSELAEHLASFWVPGQTLLYVGRTNKSLSARVAALYATELGHRRPHSGGYWLKTLRDQQKLKVWWAETDAAEEYEDALHAAFSEAIPNEVIERLPSGPLLPWANLSSPTGGERVTGLTEALLDNDLASTSRPNIKRSDAAGASRKRASAVSSGGPKSPRRSATKAAAVSAKRDQATPVTAAGLATMKAELTELTTVQRPQVVERVKNARELGDLRENADYEAARNEQSFLEGHVLELEQRIRTAVIIETRVGNSISMGSTVHYEVEGTAGTLTLVGSTESDPSAGRISAVSPVGKALLGHRVGDEVLVRTPAADIRYKILAIS